MPRIRTIKPESLQHRKVGPLPDREFRLWIGGITQSDDEGRLVADAEQLRVIVFGYHRRVTTQDVETALQALATSGLIRLYVVNGVRYADFPSWPDHQRINRPTPSKLPPFHASVIAHGGLSEGSLSAHAGSEGIGEDRNGSAAMAPEAVLFEPTAGSRNGTAAGDIEDALTVALAAPSGSGLPATLPWGTPEAMVELYHRLIPLGHPRVTKLSPARRDNAAAALRRFPERDHWEGVFGEIARSSFLQGRRPSEGHQHFRADFDWLLEGGRKAGTVENHVKVAETKYRDSTSAMDDDEDET